jgi:hypothetical protein
MLILRFSGLSARLRADRPHPKIKCELNSAFLRAELHANKEFLSFLASVTILNHKKSNF